MSTLTRLSKYLINLPFFLVCSALGVVVGLMIAPEPTVYIDTVVDTVYITAPDTTLETVTTILAPHARDAADLREVAQLVVTESRRLNLDPIMVANIIRIENPWLINDTASSAGAIGIMQIMPFHRGSFRCSGRLVNTKTNICLGTNLLRQYLEDALRSALLRYNGCQRAYCQNYAHLVESNLDD